MVVYSSASDDITLDTTPPTSLTVTINSGATYTGSRNVIINVSAIDGLSGVTRYGYKTDGDWTWVDVNPATNTFSAENVAVQLPDLDGLQYVYFNVTDEAGNDATAVESSTFSELLQRSFGTVDR